MGSRGRAGTVATGTDKPGRAHARPRRIIHDAPECAESSTAAAKPQFGPRAGDPARRMLGP
ncbi:hypothetical protein NSER024013_25810 [Nocardia seriolae]|nr:hypothetical protein NSER024013_25810 [Nocardia seriolae]